MKVIASKIRALVRKVGFDIIRYSEDEIGLDPFRDIQYFLTGIDEPMIFDVGANIGQSVDRFKHKFPESHIHSFEPSPTTFKKLKDNCCNFTNFVPHQFGVGSCSGKLEFLENSHSDMSSFLEPSEFSWGSVEETTMVDVITLDGFVSESNVDCIHILKSDTQGFDLEVFRGCSELMRQNKIALIYFEVIFSDMYKKMPSFDRIYKFLTKNGFTLVSFYEPHYQKLI